MTTYSPDTPLDKIFKGCTSTLPARMVSYIQLPHIEENRPTWGLILMACEAEQTEFLKHLWSSIFPPDDDATVVWFLVVKRGMFLKFLDTQDKDARFQFQLLTAVLQEGKLMGEAAAVNGSVNRRNPFLTRPRR